MNIKNIKALIFILLTNIVLMQNLDCILFDSSYVTYDRGLDKFLVPKMINFNEYRDSRVKRKRFIEFISLIARDENKAIMLVREKLLRLKNTQISDIDFKYIQNVEKVYNMKVSDSVSDIEWNELMERVDIIPEELAVAQAAIESAWGTSAFALKANNLFGHWTYIKGSGIVPKKRPKGSTYEVAIFKNVNDSLRKYFLNLNTNKAYKSLRVIRLNLRKERKEIDALLLANGLNKYSAINHEYCKIIQSIIKRNKKIMGNYE